MRQWGFEVPKVIKKKPLEIRNDISGNIINTDPKASHQETLQFESDDTKDIEEEVAWRAPSKKTQKTVRKPQRSRW